MSASALETDVVDPESCARATDSPPRDVASTIAICASDAWACAFAAASSASACLTRAA